MGSFQPLMGIIGCLIVAFKGKVNLEELGVKEERG